LNPIVLNSILRKEEITDMNRNYSRLWNCLALGALVLMIAGPISHTANAAEQPANPDPPFSWGGLYAGVHIGYGWGNADTRVTPMPSATTFINLAPQTQSPDPEGVLGGAQVGFNWQRGPLVLGVETDFSWSGMSGKKVRPIVQNNGTPFPGAGNFIRVEQNTDWFGTLRLRLGATPVSRLLVYGTGGLAYGRVNSSANTSFLPVGTEQYPGSVHTTKVGWTAGGGAEFALGRKWSVKAEYLYYDLGSESKVANPFPPLPPFHIRYVWEATAHTFNVGLNYRF
jgi:outer membrane immunogenic protein